MSALLGLDFLPAALRTYRTEKYMIVDVPRVGIFFRTGQIAALFIVILQLWINDGWGLVEVPGGVVNPWDETGTMLLSTNRPGYINTQPYCGNATYTYASEAYQFGYPDCQALLSAELTQKSALDVFFTTSIMETITLGWPCNLSATGVDRDSRATMCTAGGGFRYRRASGQCGCVTQKAVYPLAVEDMTLAYEHAYSTTIIGLSGASAEVNDLYSNIIFLNGSKLVIGDRQTIRLSVRDWLAAADLTLDVPNFQVPPDPQGRRATFRTTGAKVKIEIEYSNVDPVSGRAVVGKKDVHANVRSTHEGGTWNSAGVEKTWVRYPTLPRHTPQEYHLVERWRHGIQFQFTTTGRIFEFNFFYLLSVVLSGLVMLKFANTLTDLYAFNCLGAESVVLRNKRCELVSKKSEFAEIGMKAALAAATYPKFDRFCDGTIEAEDIARAFASVEGVSWEQAFMIARNILAAADSEPSLNGEPKGLNFVEFMTCIEGDACNFELFLKDTKAMFDRYMLEDEKEDAAAASKTGKKPPVKKVIEPSMKEKIKMEKEAAAAKKKARQEATEKALKLLQRKAKKAGKDFDTFMREKVEAEDDAMRERCRKAFEEEQVRVAANKPAKEEKVTGEEQEEEEEEEEEEDQEEEEQGLKACSPKPGATIEQSAEEKEARLSKSGTMRVHLASASGLTALDKGGTSDPYVQIVRGKKKKTSNVIKKTLDPTWDEELEFKEGKDIKVSLRTVISAGFELRVFDKDGLLDSDDLMGSVSVDISALEATDTIEFCEALSDGGGVIKFTIIWEPGADVSGTPKKETPKKMESEPDLEAQAGDEVKQNV